MSVVPVSQAPPTPEELEEKYRIHTVAVGLVEVDPEQPREEFDSGELNELKESIAIDGLQQVMGVRPHPSLPDHFMIVYGERRFRAVQLLGWTHIPVMVIREGDPFVISMVENTHRVNLSAIELGRGYRRLHDRNGWTYTEIAKRSGCSTYYVSVRLSMLTLPREVQTLVARRHGGLSVDAAYRLTTSGLEPEQISDAMRELLKQNDHKPSRISKAKVNAYLQDHARSTGNGTDDEEDPLAPDEEDPGKDDGSTMRDSGLGSAPAANLPLPRPVKPVVIAGATSAAPTPPLPGGWPGWIAGMGEIQQVEPRKKLLRQDTYDPRVLIILKGKVLREIELAPKRACIVDVHGAGEILGAFCTSDGTLPYSVVTHSKVTVLVINRASFLEVIFSNAPLRDRLLAQQTDLQRRDNIRSAMYNVCRVEVTVRHTLWMLAHRFGVEGVDVRGTIVAIGLTRNQLAHLAGTVLETTIRMIKRLEKAGLIITDGRTYFVPDLGKLKPNLAA